MPTISSELTERWAATLAYLSDQHEQKKEST